VSRSGSHAGIRVSHPGYPETSLGYLIRSSSVDHVEQAYPYDDTVSFANRQEMYASPEGYPVMIFLEQSSLSLSLLEDLGCTLNGQAYGIMSSLIQDVP
jgi:hypothetical protein